MALPMNAMEGPAHRETAQVIPAIAGTTGIRPDPAMAGEYGTNAKVPA